jgi:hypothetical protein
LFNLLVAILVEGFSNQVNIVVTQREFQKTQHVDFDFVAGDIF